MPDAAPPAPVRPAHPAVLASLAAAGVACSVRAHADLGRPIASPADFAEALGYPLGRITKSVFLAGRGGAGPRYAVAVCAAPDRLDFAAVTRVLAGGGPRLQVASPHELGAVLGYPSNGVSPLGVPEGVRVVMDEALLVWPTVLVGGGVAAVEVEAPPGELARACGALVAPITKRP